MCPNTYVDFVSDGHFLGCVKKVCDEYSKTSSDAGMKWLERNGLDSFKMIFDIMNSNANIGLWIKSETIRQMDKTISNWIGDFHQALLGGMDGWTDLKKGHTTGVDLMKNDETKFIELKNKHNTTKGEDLKNVFTKLENIVNRHSGAIAYYAYITPKNGTSGEEEWKIKHREPNPRIRKVWGSKVYETITGDPLALKKTWEKLPSAINEVLGTDFTFNDSDQKKIVEIFKNALQR